MKKAWMIALGLMICTPAFAAQGTGVGNGNPGDRAQYIQKLKEEMSASRSGARAELERLQDWCTRVTRVLARELNRAQLQIQYERLEQGKQILGDALIAASQSLDQDPTQGSPMIKKMIDRGIVYSDAIGETLASCNGSRQDMLTELYFLVGYFQLTLRVADELDQPYYLPYAYRYNRCISCPPEFDFDAFARKYVELAKAELRFVLGRFTNFDWRDGRWVVTPVGNPSVYLKLTELATGFVADDISGTLEAYRHACVIRDLVALSETLRDYNVFGDRTVYPNERWAVVQSAIDLDRILSNLEYGRPVGGCR